MIFFDILIAFVVMIFIMFGYKKGFTMTIYNFVSWILSFLIAKISAPIFTGYMMNTVYFSKLSSTINQKLTNLQASGSENLVLTLQNAKNGDSNGLIGDMIVEGIKNGFKIETANVFQFVSDSIATMIFNVGCMIIIFILLRIFFAVVIKLLIKNIVKMPVIKQIDKVGGVGIGFLEGLIVSYIIVMILNIVNLGGIGGEFEKTYIVKYFLNLDLVKSTFLIFLNR